MELGARVALLGLLLCFGVAHAAPRTQHTRVAARQVGRPPGPAVQPVAGAAEAVRAPVRPRVTSVELQLPAGSDATGLADLVSLRTGQALSPREVRRSVERLWRTGRFSDVVVRTVPDADGVRAVFVLTPRATVVSVAVEGNQVLDDAAVLEAAGFVGSQKAEAVERLVEAERAVLAAYAARGFDGARVRARSLPVQGGVEVLVEVEEGSASRIASVSFTGEPALPTALLLKALDLVPGTTLDRTRVETGLERLRELFRERRYYTARVESPEEKRVEEGIQLAIPVHAGPRFELRFEGNRSIPSTQLEAALGYDGEEPLDAALVQRFLRRLTAFYRYRGFHAAEVTASQELTHDGTRALLTFVVREDLPWVVEEVRFEGREALRAEELKGFITEQLRSRTPQAPGARVELADPVQLEGRTRGAPQRGAALPEVDSVFVEEAYREAASLMTQEYRERGFLRAVVELKTVDFDPSARTVAVRYDVAEGPHTRVASVVFDGAPADFPTEGLVPLTVDAAFSPAALERGRAAVDQALTRRGHLFAEVQSDVKLSEDGAKAHVRFVLQAGPRVRVGKVLFTGLERSDEGLLRANLTLREGEVLDPEQLFESQRNLVLLGLFRQVAVRLASPETVEPVKDVVVEVRERPRMEGDVAFGYFLAEGPRLLLDTDVPNMFGRGYSLQARARVNYVGLSALPDASTRPGIHGLGGRGNLAFLFPRFFLSPWQVGARVDAVGERTFRPTFDFTRFAGILGMDVRTLGWLTVNVQGELEYDRVELNPIRKPDPDDFLVYQSYADEQRVRFPPGSFTLWSLRTTATADFRDDPANTRKGVLVSGTAEVTDDLFIDFDGVDDTSPLGDIRTLKLSGNVTGYVPLGPRVVLAASARGGSLFALYSGAPKTGSLTIPPKRFYLGGATSLRGFREDGLMSVERRRELRTEREDCRRLVAQAGCTAAAQLLEQGVDLRSEGGDAFALGKLELRLPLVAAVDLGLFAEAGNLWQRAEALALEDLRYVAGAGIRYVTPVGPLALDVGINLDPDSFVNEPAASVHFSIGLF
ncbi:MAG: BamA/TamA family outer membrane protein [Myxococcaceae bacterium]|nr:BamA/TamA family outer membrane protein [Myxococcaceae bacterium]